MVTERTQDSPTAQMSRLWGHLTVFAEDGGSVQVVGDAWILLKRTFHLFPGDELSNLLGQFQKFLPGLQRYKMEQSECLGKALAHHPAVILVDLRCSVVP